MRDVYALRRKIGMVAPLPVGLPLSIYDNVAFAPRAAGLTRTVELDDLVERCLRQAALWDEVKDRLDSLGTKLSGGQQQRLTIARALSHQPEILCLDEFSIAIDPVTTMRIEDVLKELQQRDDDHAGDQPGAAGAPPGRPHDVPAGTARSSSSDRTEVIFSEQPAEPAHVRLRERDLRMSERPGRPTASRRATLNLWYGEVPGAARRVAVDIRPRLITSLIGPSGCGKTTLLRCFNRVNERYGYVRTTGEIKVLGKNIYDPDVSLVELRKAVGMVFQRPNPLPISVYENVVFGLRIHARAAAADARGARRGGRERAQRGGALGRPEGPAARQRHRACSSSSSRSCASRGCCR